MLVDEGAVQLAPELIRLRKAMLDEEERHRATVDALLARKNAQATASKSGRDAGHAESKIFMRAAFQLAHQLDPPSGTDRSKNDGIVHEGLLRKVHMRGVGSRQAMTWKAKMVQIRHGEFIYADEQGLGHITKAKSLPLRNGYCTCRLLEQSPANILGAVADLSGLGFSGDNRVPASTFSAVDGRGQLQSLCAFELTVNGGVRRLWSAGNRDECKKWVAAVNAAMTEGPPTSSASGGYYKSDSARNVSPAPDIPEGSPHALDMGNFLAMRSRLRGALSVRHYLQALKPMLHPSPVGGRLGVPVEWVKQQLFGSSAIFQSDRKYGPSAVEQLRKDMQRDVACINGKVIRGDEGMEHIVGELLSCILDQAGTLEGALPMDEAQALVVAREVLLACNRTTSAGDTYLVVDELCRNRDLVVLVPALHEAQPLVIDVVPLRGDSSPICRANGAGDTRPSGIEPSIKGIISPKFLRYGVLASGRSSLRNKNSVSSQSPGRNVGGLHRSIRSESAILSNAASDNVQENADSSQHGAISSKEQGEGEGQYLSHLRITCIAQTAYKLFSTDPQDEDRDVFAVVSGIFRQTFTVMVQDSLAASEGNDPNPLRTDTDGSVCFVSLDSTVDSDVGGTSFDFCDPPTRSSGCTPWRSDSSISSHGDD